MKAWNVPAKVWLLHAAVILLLFALQFVLPAYHHGVLARIMVLAVFAMGYNLLFGYVGLLSLGHAMFFSAGLYGAGLTMQHLGWGVPAGFVAGVAAGALLGLVIGVLALRTTGVAFMIVTMMFAQVFYLMILYFSDWTRGDEGFVLPQQARAISLGDLSLDLSDPSTRYWAALALFSIVLLITRGDRPLASWPRAGGDPRERGAHAHARLRHLRQQARRRRRLRHDLRRGRRRPMPCCSAMSARPSPRCSIRSCRCCGCCSAAPPRRSGRSSARCSCTTWSTSPAATPRPIC